MNIGFVTTESPYGRHAGGGIASYLRTMIPALLDAGHRVTVLANSKEDEHFHEEGGRVPVYHFRLPSTHWYAAKIPGVRRLVPLPLRQLEWSAALYRRVARIAAREKIDVLESTETGAMFLSRIAPLVIRLHGSEFAFRKHAGMPMDFSVRLNDSLEAYSCRRAVAMTTPSHFQANEMITRRGWPSDRVQVIPNPISSTILQAGLQFQGNGTSEPIVLYTGRLAPVKGIDTLLGAAKLVHDRNPGVTFVLAGPWQMPHPPATYGLELNRTSADGVQWIGARDQSELIAWYKRAAVFVMPSYFESFGISVVEAMAFGLPVVCTRAGGLPEVVVDGVNGTLVASGDAEAVAEAMIHLLRKSGLHRGMRDAGRKRVLDEFTVDRVLPQTLSVYEAILRN